MKFYHHGKKGIFQKWQKVYNSVRWKGEHEQDGRVHCVEASAKANLILPNKQVHQIKIMKRVDGLQTLVRNSTIQTFKLIFHDFLVVHSSTVLM